MAEIVNEDSALGRAKRLLTSQSLPDLRYCALELRLCIEALTYEKLREYTKYLPTSAARKWQPPQLLKALCQVDPRADESVTLCMGPVFEEGVTPADSEFQVVGTHNALESRWLRRNYGKLGSCLHSGGKLADDQTALREYLSEVLLKVEAAQSSTLRSMIHVTPVTFQCPNCSEKNAVSDHQLETTARAECLNPQCGIELNAEKDGSGNWTLSPRSKSAPCLTCGATITIQERQLRDEALFACAACGSNVEIRWIIISSG